MHIKVQCVPEKLLGNDRTHVQPEEDVISEVLNETQHELKLFMGHTVRCKVQTELIDKIYKTMLSEPAENLAILNMDYKIKYEPRKYREKVLRLVLV